MPGAEGTAFCTRDCALDTDCSSRDKLYCCEESGEKTLCTLPVGGACRQATLGDACANAGDPFCARGGLHCGIVDSTREICTRACTSSADCSAVSNAECTTVNGEALCVPPDPTTVRKSDCGGDSDCKSGQICQFFADNDANPTGLVTQCSDLKRGTVAAFATCTQAMQQCDRDFCESGFCPATCVNDSYCRSGFICTPLQIVVRADDPSTPANEQIVSVLGLCTKQPGSLAPCDRESATNCPNGESCGFVEHIDGTLDARCETLPAQSGANGGITAGDVCSPLTDANSTTPATRAPVSASDGQGGSVVAVRVCATALQEGVDACFAQSPSAAYCVAPCRSDNDCPTTRASDNAAITMACVYKPFEPLCLATEFNQRGKIDGSPCAASDNDSADSQCASLFCNGGSCAPRNAAGTACTRQDQCESLICLNSTCQQLCRADSECTSGHICSGTPFLIDVNNTPQNSTDDRFDLPTICQLAVSPRAPCQGDSDCATGDVCQTLFNRDGSLGAACVPRSPSGLGLGMPCTAQASCSSGLCLGASGVSKCSAACGDDSDCTSGMRCEPATLFGTAVDRLCLGTQLALAVDGASCATFSDCQSNLCANGSCRPLCPKGAHAGDAFGSPGDESICVPTPVSVNGRSTQRTSDDLVGYVLSPVRTVPCKMDSSGTTCVYRPTSATTLQGYVLTPNTDARDNGALCQLAVNCKSGLCVGGACVAPCTAAGPTCGDSHRSCVVGAQALTLEDSGTVATVSACIANSQ